MNEFHMNINSIYSPDSKLDESEYNLAEWSGQAYELEGEDINAYVGKLKRGDLCKYKGKWYVRRTNNMGGLSFPNGTDWQWYLLPGQE